MGQSPRGLENGTDDCQEKITMPLSDCFVDLIAYVAYGIENPETLPGSTEDLARYLDVLIVSSEEKRVQGGYSQEDYDLARFAVFVWIDETIMKSSIASKQYWQKNLLQRTYYKTTGGGVEFYRRLDALDADQDPIREVYVMCLALGYAGRYAINNDDQVTREAIKAKHVKRLTGSNEALSSMISQGKMFPGSYSLGDSTSQAVKRHSPRPSWVSLCLGIAPVGVFAFLYFLYRFILNNEILAKLVV